MTFSKNNYRFTCISSEDQSLELVSDSEKEGKIKFRDQTWKFVKYGKGVTSSGDPVNSYITLNTFVLKNPDNKKIAFIDLVKKQVFLPEPGGGMDTELAYLLSFILAARER